VIIVEIPRSSASAKQAVAGSCAMGRSSFLAFGYAFTMQVLAIPKDLLSNIHHPDQP